MTRPVPVVFAALVALAIFAAAPARAEENTRTISVTASGTVVAAPDRARIRAGAVSEAGSARAALDGNAQTIRKVFSGLSNAGIDPKDIQTSRFDVQPVYSRPKTGKPQITGYRVINQLEVVVHDVAKLGRLIDRVVTLGANQIDSVRFEVSDLEQRKDDARRQAMRNAIRRATLYAQAGGAHLGDVLRINERVSGSGRNPTFQSRIAATPAPIATGQLELTVSVDVTWALR
jgi:uncharacterized protein YggE